LGEVMTKAEFGEQFKRLRIAGYRLPVFDGVKVGEVVDEWYGTFGSCSVAEFSHAIEKLKQTKTDTWWPATGELWTHIFQYRKERKIRSQANDGGHSWSMSDEDVNEFLAVFRECKQRVLAKMTMPHAEPQVEPDHVLLEQEEREWEG
jgi:hypothetical protein